jgi:hypothetical protein
MHPSSLAFVCSASRHIPPTLHCCALLLLLLLLLQTLMAKSTGSTMLQGEEKVLEVVDKHTQASPGLGLSPQRTPYHVCQQFVRSGTLLTFLDLLPWPFSDAWQQPVVW